MDEELKAFILEKARTFNALEAVEDSYFTSRLLRDVLHGRCKRNNKSSRYKDKDSEAGGLEFLIREFEQQKRKEAEVPIQICPRDGGSLMTMRTASGETFLKCPMCGSEYGSIPPKGANPDDYKRKETK